MFQWWVVGLVLHFDGSLRPPRDPGFPKSNLGRMASCGAAIYDDHNALLALGGKSLDIIPDITSADVEYDGLLFGATECIHKGEDTLTIRGDCKAIIDQLHGRAVPRKLKPKHEVALKLLERIENVSFEHVPREDNKLCDAICAAVMNIIEERQVATFRQELTSFGANKDVTNSELIDVLKRLLSSTKSVVRYSSRPPLYQGAALIAERLDDGMALEHIGQRLVLEAKLWPADGIIRKELMAAQGILWQVRGCRLQGNDKLAKRLSHNHRHMLDRSASRNEIIDAFASACDKSNSLGGSSFVIPAECDQLLQTWYDQAAKQDDRMLKEGFWITR